jgi:hypothetical protein
MSVVVEQPVCGIPVSCGTFVCDRINYKLIVVAVVYGPLYIRQHSDIQAIRTYIISA